MKTCNLFAIGIFLVLIPLCALADEKKSNSTMGTKTSGLYEVEYSLEPMSNTIPPLHEFKVIVRDLRSKEILTHANMRFEKNVLMSGGSLEIKNEKSIEAMKNLAEFSDDKNAAQDGITISVFYAYDKVADRVIFKMNIYKGAEVAFAQSAALRWADLKK